MATIPRVAPFPGMWTGNAAEDGYAELAVNVDVSDGSIRTRPGFYRIVALGGGRGRGFYCQDRMDGRRIMYGICVTFRTSSSSGGVRLTVMDENGATLNTTMQLDALGVIPYDRPFAMTELGDIVYMSNGAGPIIAVNPNKSYEPYVVVAANGQFADAYHYWGEMPQATIMVNHEGMMIYAGLPAAGAGVPLLAQPGGTSVLHTNQKEIEEVLVGDSSRGWVNINDKFVVFSDRFTPNQIGLPAYIGVSDGNPWTAIASVGGVVFLWTKTSTHAAIGLDVGSDLNYKLQRISSTIGCVGQGSVQVIDNTVVWCALDGFYRATPDGQIEKVSKPLDKLFNGSYDPVTPRGLWATLARIGAPFTPSAAHGFRASSVIDPVTGYYICSLTSMQQSSARPNAVTLAWHYPSGNAGWSAWCGYDTSTTAFLPQMWSRFTADHGKTYFLSDAGWVCRMAAFGTISTDIDTSNNRTPIPMIYVTKPMMEGLEQRQEFGQWLLRCTGSGQAQGQFPRVIVSGEETQYDRNTSATTAVSEQPFSALMTHPKDTAPWYYSKAGLTFGDIPAGSGALFTPRGRVTISRHSNVTSRWFQLSLWDEGASGNFLEVHGMRCRFTVLGEDT